MYACVCNAVTEGEVRAKAQRNCFTMAHYVGTCNVKCCKCLPRIKELLDEAKQAREEAAGYYGTSVS